MTASSDTSFILPVQRIDELFNAPASDPFSDRPLEVLGEAGFDHLWKRMVRHWPRKADLQRVIVQLPPDQITPALTDSTRTAWQRYCAAQIEKNRQKRRLDTRKALRLWAYAGVILLFALAFIALMFLGPLSVLPEWLRAVLALLGIYAFALANWDALDSLLFDWAPFVRDNTTYQLIASLDLIIEPQPDSP